MINRRTPLQVFNSKSVSGQRYWDEALQSYARLFSGVYGSDILFLDNHTRLHRRNLVGEYLEGENIERILWSKKSPDFNPIENLLDYLLRGIAHRHLPPRYVNALKTALLESRA